MDRATQKKYIGVFQDIPWDTPQRLSTLISQFNTLEDIKRNNIDLLMLQQLAGDIGEIEVIISRMATKLERKEPIHVQGNN